MITSDRMAAVDRNAEALGIPRKQLMESSGHAVGTVVTDYADTDTSITIVAGRGNNGGDAFVAARFLDAYDPTIILLGRPESIRTEIAKENWKALQVSEYQTYNLGDSRAVDQEPIGPTLENSDIIVDGILGTGITGGLREPTATVTKRINESPATVVAVDVPTGVDPDDGSTAEYAVQADHVVTFHDRKPGLAEYPGTVTVADIGIPDAAELFVGPGDLERLARRPDAHKGDHGDILVVGGGPYTGAPALTAQAALRAGADLVRVACPESIAETIQGYSENLIVKSLPGQRLGPDHVDQLRSWAAEQDSVVFGPGLGRHKETQRAAKEFLQTFDGRTVVDADPLRVLSDIEPNGTLVCTPHQGELRAMGGPTETEYRARMAAIEDFVADRSETFLVKGQYDIISDGTVTRVNRTGNPGMTVGGTGDVLAGVTGALLATVSPRQAAAIAAYVTGRAGDLLADRHDYGFTASDVLSMVPEAMHGDQDD